MTSENNGMYMPVAPAYGRYVSHESSGRSYEDGYSEGYSEAMSQAMNMGNSGHYPMPPYPTRRY